jgi:hypothetical protein
VRKLDVPLLCSDGDCVDVYLYYACRVGTRTFVPGAVIGSIIDWHLLSLAVDRS